MSAISANIYDNNTINKPKTKKAINNCMRDFGLGSNSHDSDRLYDWNFNNTGWPDLPRSYEMPDLVGT